MKTIWKFTLERTDAQTINPPKGAVCRLVAVQHGELCAWLEVEAERITATWQIRIFGTGHNIGGAAGMQHLGSVIDGPFVWHVYGEEL